MKRLARLADISFAERAPEGAVQLLVRGEVAALPLKGVIDLAGRDAPGSTRKSAKADADIKRVDAKLGNEKFVANAPEEIVEEEKEKREAALARKAKLQEALERLKQGVPDARARSVIGSRPVAWPGGFFFEIRCFCNNISASLLDCFYLRRGFSKPHYAASLLPDLCPIFI